MAFHKVFFFATRFGNLKKTLNFISVCTTIYWVKQMQPAELIMLALILLMGALQARLVMAIIFLYNKANKDYKYWKSYPFSAIYYILQQTKIVSYNTTH